MLHALMPMKLLDCFNNPKFGNPVSHRIRAFHQISTSQFMSCNSHISRSLIVTPRPRNRCNRKQFFCARTPLKNDTEDAELNKRPCSQDDSFSIVDNLLHFLNDSWTQFHATAEVKRFLVEAGFKPLREQDAWDVQPGGRYFFTRNMSCIVAFAVGERYVPGKGFHIIAAHTDSPCLKLKPVSAISKLGFLMVNVQTYGAGLWHTWFDRDLSVAGRVILRRDDGSFFQKLVRVNRPIMRIPTLAIHLDRSVNTDGFKPNFESHIVPMLASEVNNEISLPSNENNSGTSSNKSQHSLLLKVLAEELHCSIEELADFELNVCDTQPSCLGGSEKDFIYSGRLDNLASCFLAVKALIDSSSSGHDLANESSVRMVALFDNEEVGSDSAQGAGAPVLVNAIKRIAKTLSMGVQEEGVVERSIRQSFIVSADMAHGLHPNYPEKHEGHHQPKLQKGIVIKHNANQRYATNSVTSFLFKEIAKAHNLPTQDFVVRNDMGCGSTIGPILASGIGIRTVDCGIPQLSMHSVREMCGVDDIVTGYKHFKAFYEMFSDMDHKLTDG